MNWLCLKDSCRHKWSSTYNNFQVRKGCPKCNKLRGAEKRKVNIIAYQNAAILKGGKCLSKTVNSCYDKLKFECVFGHQWFGRADQIKNTSQWCPKCAKERKIK